MLQKKIIDRLHNSGIEELKSVVSLNEMNGDFINLECRLPNGTTGKILDDNKKCLAIQVEISGNYNVTALSRTRNKLLFSSAVALGDAST